MNSALKWMPLVAVIALATAGCGRDGFYHDRNLDYGEAEESAPLVLPDSRNVDRYRDAMPVPEVGGTRSAENGVVEAPLPQALSPGRARERGYVERRAIGDENWLVVGVEPGAAWTELERFARRRGLTVTNSDSRRGILETDQATLSVRPALRSGDSEIHCEQGRATQADCLTALERHFEARSLSSSAASLAAQRPASEPGLRLEQRGEEWLVQIPLDINRTWAELSYQLEQVFTLEERRELLERDPRAHDFLISYMTESERNRNPLEVAFSPDVRQMSQQIRLVLETRGPEQTLLRAVNASERDFHPEDQRELLERVAGLLR
ncbi:MAG: lipoprotein, NlpB [Halomonas sp.]|uniref:lipoprotein, NlpB n=1 Tax=Halomonas sp. TaxID=1486246 RepID=UPI00287067E1|nr:lipoprotein, NlpB [Halomonas sp.]MDR9439381.1 lipoprotein, NlpB [Halomonas sp.]